MTTPQNTADTHTAARGLENGIRRRDRGGADLPEAEPPRLLATPERPMTPDGTTGPSGPPTTAGQHGLPTPKDLQNWLADSDKTKKETDDHTHLPCVCRRNDTARFPNPTRPTIPRVRRLMAGLNRTCVCRRGALLDKQPPCDGRDIERIIDTAHIPRHNQPGGGIENPRASPTTRPSRHSHDHARS